MIDQKYYRLYCMTPFVWSPRQYKHMYSNKKQISRFLGLGKGREEWEERMKKWDKGILMDDNMFLILIMVIVSWMYVYAKT